MLDSIKIEYSPYSLIAKSSLNSRCQKLQREGALLKVYYADDKVGYADCHPWVELGDLPLNDQLSHLARNNLTPLTRRSLHFAKVDADARARQYHLFTCLKSPLSHFLIGDLANFSPLDLELAMEEGHRCFKIKVGRDSMAELQQLKTIFSKAAITLRLDFNEKLTKDQLETFLFAMDDGVKESIDFIEDPFPYNEKSWEDIQSKFYIQLACDRRAPEAKNRPFSSSTLILKPAIQSPEQLISATQPLIVTSYLDHPLGQLAAAYTTCQLENYSDRIHGLNSHYLYQENTYSRQLSSKGPKFIFPVGTGFGFNELLEEESWQPILT